MNWKETYDLLRSLKIKNDKHIYRHILYIIFNKISSVNKPNNFDILRIYPKQVNYFVFEHGSIYQSKI